MDILWDILSIEECNSSNTYLGELLSQNPTINEGFTIRTNFQSQGRGQRDNIWKSNKGDNLLISFLLKPGLPAKRQFLLNQIVCLGICEYLIDHDIKGEIRIKWPNDIYVDDRKICGILIQNMLQGVNIHNSIVGIGLNINQKEFDQSIPNPTSLSLEKENDYNLENEMIKLLDCINSSYQELFRVRKAKPQSMYRFLLYKLNEEQKFITELGKEFVGIIKGVDDLGRLEVESEGVKNYYNFSEIKFIIEK